MCHLLPRNLPARIEIAKAFIREYDFQIPFLVDGMDDKVERVFNAFPERLYVLEHRRVVYRGGIGPINFRPEEVHHWLQYRC